MKLQQTKGLKSFKLQRLLYLNPEAVRPTVKKPDAPTAPAEPREAAYNRAVPQTGKDAPKADGRAVERLRAVYAHCAPLPPTMPPDDAPLDDVLAYFNVLEAAGMGVGTPEGGCPALRPSGEILPCHSVPTIET